MPPPTGNRDRNVVPAPLRAVRDVGEVTVAQGRLLIEKPEGAWVSAGVLFLLLFCFVIMSHKLPLGEVAIVGAGMAVLVQNRRLTVPVHFRWYLLYVLLGSIGWLASSVPLSSPMDLYEAYKLLLIGLACCWLLNTKKDVRFFTIGYLALFALYPARGALYNYLTGATHFGRISWNFIFANPNDLALTCLFPIGLCGYLFFTERGWIRVAATMGVAVLLLVMLLTQSRGALLGIAVAGAYFLAFTRYRVRFVSFALLAVVVAGIFAPVAVWDRMRDLSKADVNNMSAVDSSAGERWEIMKIGIGVVLQNPFLGVGFGNYRYAHAEYALRNGGFSVGASSGRDAHSMYIRAAAESGIFGSICVAAFSFGALFACRRLRKRLAAQPGSERHVSALLALEMSMVAFLVAGLFSSSERTTYMLLQFLVPYYAAAVVLAQYGLTVSGVPERPLLRRGVTAD